MNHQPRAAQCRTAYVGFCRGLSTATSTQAALLREMVEASCDSQFGREHHYADIHDLASFRDRVPLRYFSGFRPYIERTIAGEPKVLSSEPVFKYLSSSGSTGTTKVIPATRRYFAQAFNPFYMTYLHSALAIAPRMLDDSALTINFKWDPQRRKPALANGAQHLGFSQLNLAREFDDDTLSEPGTATPWASAAPEVEADLERLYHKLRIASDYDIRQLVGINPALIAAIPALLDANADRLADDLERGALAGRVVTTPNLALAHALRGAKRAYGQLLPRHVWKNIQSIVCWDEGISAFYLPRVARAFGDKARIVAAPLAASESPIALHLWPDQVRGVMAYNTVFYEFLDVQAGPNATPLLLNELQLGGHYALVVTQQSGFHRYVLGDIIEVTGFAAGVPTVGYAGRYDAARTIQESELLSFMRAVTRTYDLELKNFSFELGDERVLDLTLEFSRAKSAAELTKLAAQLRTAFALSRSGTTHRIERVRQVEPGHFWQNWRRRVVAGMRPAQVKDCVLSSRSQLGAARPDLTQGGEPCSPAS